MGCHDISTFFSNTGSYSNVLNGLLQSPAVFLVDFELNLCCLLMDGPLSVWLQNMGETRENEAYEEELIDYEEEDEKAPDSAAKVNGEGAKKYVQCTFAVEVAPSIVPTE